MYELEGWQMTFIEFNKRFEGELVVSKSLIEAYNNVENYHLTKTGTTKYSSYNSFQTIRAKKIKGKTQ